ncbi:MAG: L-glutamate gamma-semialdehyde dehydrogenase [Bacteroidetes bacterium]|nr:L-glutamate gamma-semialdehyde dehydrogenase [Bacteroidota bacterium]MCY4205240.1 L-glutamate gamma-semialdehyde dehydrogenase [Bacteroidota bacterium]
MNNSKPVIPTAINEPVLDYAPGSSERASLQEKLRELKQTELEIPAFIHGDALHTGDLEEISPPHELSHRLAQVHKCGAKEVHHAIKSALEARRAWSELDFIDRAAIFLKAAELLAGPWRDVLNASTMLGQSKNAYQAEIDAACELIDFFRFNVEYASKIYEEQPYSSQGVWNRLEYRPLEGFVFAVTPFNFTSITGNLPTAPALMGNTVIWKPASTSIYSAYFIYKLLEEAGLPPGVINMVPGSGAAIGDPVLASSSFSGLHFTGSTETFQHMWRTIGANIANYDTYPRIVGETGGKDFILAHASADPDAVATAIVRGAFEYQGQKCSAASRVYLPESQWRMIKDALLGQLDEIKMGTVEDFSNFINAVIDHKSYQNIVSYIEGAKQSVDTEIIAGGHYSSEEGYFIEPTVILTSDPQYRTMCEEIFGPVVTIFVYKDEQFKDILPLVDQTSPYALTGAVFARDRQVIVQASNALRNAAGNFYINDKPTGAVVGQQPFGGARASGTNDKAGAPPNLMRWVSVRTIKETFNPPTHFGYSFNQPDNQ